MRQLLFLLLLCLPLTIKSQIVVGYYYGDKSSFSHDLIEYNCLTHIAHAFIIPDSSGELSFSSSFIYPELVRAVHDNGKKIVVSVGGWGGSGGFKQVAADPRKRSLFISNLTRFIKLYGYDGADIDWEYPKKDDKKNFNDFIAELRTAFDSAGVEILSAALPALDHHDVFDVQKLKDKLTWFGIMTYDFYGPWEPKSGLNTALYSTAKQDFSVDMSITHWKNKGVPEEKLCMGMEFAGYLFESEEMHYPHSGARSVIYPDALGKLNYGWKYNWNDEAKVPYLSTKDSIITIDDTSSIRYKSEYIVQNKIAGTIIWRMGLDYINGHSQLLNVIGDYYYSVKPGKPELLKPENTSLLCDSVVSLSWNRTPAAGNYIAEVSLNSDFKKIIFSQSIHTSSVNLPELNPGGIYYWRVCSENSSGRGEWSDAFSFVLCGNKSKLMENIEFNYISGGDWDYSICMAKDKSAARVKLLNIRGQEMKINTRNYINEEVNTILIDWGTLIPGSYHIVLNMNYCLKTKKIWLLNDN